MISSLRFTNGNRTSRKKDSIAVSVSWFLHTNPDTAKNRNFFFSIFWFLSIFNLIFLYEIGFNFIQKNLKWKIRSYRGRFVGLAFDIDPYTKSLIVQSFPKVVIKNYSARFSKWCFCVSTGLISPLTITSGNTTSRKKGSIQFSISRCFASKSAYSQ